MTNIYVGNLSLDTTEETLREAFASHGEIRSVRIVSDRETGRPRGFGFVEMVDDEAAKKAIEALNGADLEGSALNVSEAKPKRYPSPGGTGRGSWRGNR